MAAVSQLWSTFLDDLKQSPVGKALLAERGAKTHASRQVMVDELDTLRLSVPVTRAKHDKAIEPLKAAADASKAKHEAATAKLRDAQSARLAAVYALTHRMDRLESQLRASADSRIDEARQELANRYERARHTMGRSDERPTEFFDGVSGKRIMQVINNQRAIADLQLAMREARGTFDALKIQNPPDVETAIAEILAPVEIAWEALDTLEPAR